jgi:hypothetical protein
MMPSRRKIWGDYEGNSAKIEEVSARRSIPWYTAYSMKRFLLTFVALAVFLLVGMYAFGGLSPSHVPAKNPDPNHLHVDIAVWLAGKQKDFSAPQYMTSEAQEDALPSSSPRKYLHFHDGNWHVLHIHKPGQTLGTFLQSLDFRLQDLGGHSWCVSAMELAAQCEGGAVHLFINGVERPGNPGMYIFEDTDHVLLTDATTDADIQRESVNLTDDACLYSKTCPWRGDPPSEKCIADPSVPCRL